MMEVSCTAAQGATAAGIFPFNRCDGNLYNSASEFRNSLFHSVSEENGSAPVHRKKARLTGSDCSISEGLPSIAAGFIGKNTLQPSMEQSASCFERRTWYWQRFENGPWKTMIPARLISSHRKGNPPREFTCHTRFDCQVST